MASETNDPRLGNFSRLPPEIRSLIWEQLSLAEGQASSAPKTGLGILRASHRLYEEASPHVYQHEELRIQISPQYKYRSWLTIIDRRGVEWHLQDLDDAARQGFFDLPYEKLKMVVVEIQAPDEDDPGQIICLWKKVLDLVYLFMAVGLRHSLPAFNVVLLDTDHAHWFKSTHGKIIYPQRSILTQDDYEVILKSFYRLRKVREAFIIQPKQTPDDDWLQDFFFEVEEMMESQKPFGVVGACNYRDLWSDNMNIRDQDTCWNRFDEALDDLEGPTAWMLRLDRFASWYTKGIESDSKYVDEWKRIDRNQTALDSSNSASAIYRRYCTMRALNPLSVTAQRLSLSMTGKDIGSNDIKEGWDEDEWHRYYPNGLKPLSEISSECKNCGRPFEDVISASAFERRLRKKESRESSEYY